MIGVQKCELALAEMIEAYSSSSSKMPYSTVPEQNRPDQTSAHVKIKCLLHCIKFDAIVCRSFHSAYMRMICYIV